FKFVSSDGQKLIPFPIPRCNRREPRIQSIAQNCYFVLSCINHLFIHAQISEPVDLSNQPANSRRDRPTDKQAQRQCQGCARQSDGEQPKTRSLRVPLYQLMSDLCVLGIDIKQGGNSLPHFGGLRADTLDCHGEGLVAVAETPKGFFEMLERLFLFFE